MPVSGGAAEMRELALARSRRRRRLSQKKFQKDSRLRWRGELAKDGKQNDSRKIERARLIRHAWERLQLDKKMGGGIGASEERTKIDVIPVDGNKIQDWKGWETREGSLKTPGGTKGGA